MPRHEVDDFRRDLLGSTDKIALVFAIFVVNNDDHATVTDVSDGLFDGR
jgi:hypothetical protein